MQSDETGLGVSQGESAEITALTERVARLEAQVAGLQEQRETKGFVPLRGRVPFAGQQVKPVETGPALGAPVVVQRSESLESQLGTQVLSKVAVLLLLIGAAWFLKWAFDNRWIGPLGRVVAGLLAGAAVVVWSERFRRRGFAAFSYALKAVGSGVLYLSLWAGFQTYHLMPAWVALTAMIAVTGWNAFMAWAQDAELLAGYALLGAYLTPMLVSTGGNHEIFLFSYLLAIAMGVVAWVALKPWAKMLLPSLAVTAIYFVAWYTEFFYQTPQVGVTATFALLLWAAFAVVALVARQRDGMLAGVLTPLGAGAFGALTMYSVLVDSGHRAMEPWVAVAFAAVYLGMTRVRREGVAAAVHLSLAVVFLTIAIPLKATGRGITVGWLVEGVVLLWVSGRGLMERKAVKALRWLACGSLLLGVGGAVFGALIWRSGTAFANRGFATEVLAVLALAAVMGMAAQMEEGDHEAIGSGALVLMNLVMLMAMHREIAIALQGEAADFAYSGWMLLQGVAMMAAGFWKRMAFVRWLGLLLLAATIVKAFAYDMRSLGTGYRVLSALGLGVVLMAVSFAYQKDWLGLKDQQGERA